MIGGTHAGKSAFINSVSISLGVNQEYHEHALA